MTEVGTRRDGRHAVAGAGHVEEDVSASTSDNGLSGLLEVLDQAGVAYWIDSGVLLGLIRNGRMNPWEKDIDLAATGTELQRLLAAEDAFRRVGYGVSVNRYRGIVYSVSLNPPEAEAGMLRASVHVYHEVGEYLWSPQAQLFVPPPAPDVYPRKRSWGGRFLRWVIERRLYTGAADENAAGGEESRVSRAPDRESMVRRGARWLYHRFDRGFMAETWPVSEVYVPLTWVIPKDLVLPLARRTIGDRDYPAPHRAEDYLTYRYGDWRTPVRNWCYWVDDGAIRRERPFEVRKRLLQGKG